MTLHFTPIELDRQEAYRDRLRLTPRITSDYSFVNLWGWRREHGLQWAWEDDLVWIKQTAPETVYWAPVGDWRRIDWAARLDGAPPAAAGFVRVPETLVSLWESAEGLRMTAEETPEHSDYIHAYADLAFLKGPKYHKKKNLLNQFLKNYDFRYVRFDADVVARTLQMQENWCEWRDCASMEALAAENRVIANILGRWDRLTGLMGGGLIVDNEMAAYTVAEMLSEDTLLIHFEKGSPGVKGAYQAINQMFLADLDQPVAYVNREQDLGDPGLRKAKMSYHPTDFNRKFRVAPA